MYIFKAIVACTLVLGTTLAFAQTTPVDGMKNVIRLSATGSVEVQQDLLSISMTTTRDGSDAGVVQNHLKQALDSALALARQVAVAGQMEVHTGNFSLYPRYASNGKINGWQGTTELVLEGRDFARITNTAGKIQTLTLGNVSFALSREQRLKVEAEAQIQAIERFKAKALAVANSFGFGGYTLREVAINANDQAYMQRPQLMMSNAKSADMTEAAIPVESGKSQLVVNVSGSVQMTSLPVR